ncbi:glycine zipper domain-containing protein [Pelagicoccus sp. SDUM812002]|uniref:YMGG-like glycine zipper-containing protein n=1 Tax=Pelagicoccus sp. SDUM812002 TaxID=3041266 RepID=UPI00280F7D6D|nr:glycine zipper domain-containing protein [Pelagicoccus sp. SDUM812002]MDQ8186774.1 glycine zipper domain-containing protein [Pelagicoccus sp. SDUM812002]
MKTISRKNTLLAKPVAGAFSAGLLCLGLLGCSSSGYHERRGTAAGATAGAVIGGIVGHQSGEEGEGAAIGAAAGALVGREMGRSKDDSDYPAGSAGEVDTAVDYGSLLTEDEKERIRERAGREVIVNWSAHLTREEKQRLVDRAGDSVGG